VGTYSERAIPFVIRGQSPLKKMNANGTLTWQAELLAQAPGILAWLVQGYYDWKEKGLDPPLSIQKETEEYRNAENSMAHFISECCTVGPPDLETPAESLFQAYANFCEEVGFKPLVKKRFFQAMTLDFEKDRKNYGIIYKGIEIKQANS
jgi:phage/plasmid-associated DNA primase